MSRLVTYQFGIALWRAKTAESAAVKYWEIIADNLSKAGRSWGCVSAVDRKGRTIFVADALLAPPLANLLVRRAAHLFVAKISFGLTRLPIAPRFGRVITPRCGGPR
jgi:hypothetical protein